MMATPRRICGQKISLPVQSEVIGVMNHNEMAKADNPNVMSFRGSIFRASFDVIGAVNTIAAPETKTASPICSESNPLILPL